VSDVIDILVTRARVAAGISWDGKDGGHGNATVSQETEVRNILRDCANALESIKRESTAYGETIESVREALGQKETHYLVMSGDVKELVEAIELCASDGGCRAMTVLRHLQTR
jgi:hypothetical protein